MKFEKDKEYYLTKSGKSFFFHSFFGDKQVKIKTEDGELLLLDIDNLKEEIIYVEIRNYDSSEKNRRRILSNASTFEKTIITHIYPSSNSVVFEEAPIDWRGISHTPRTLKSTYYYDITNSDLMEGIYPLFLNTDGLPEILM